MKVYKERGIAMIHISGHLRNTRREMGYEDRQHPLIVNCCGFQKFLTKDYEKLRPQGRLDYQIIYISKGCGFFDFGSGLTALPAGSIVLYPPGVPQQYAYFARNTPEVFWVHFTGTECERLLKEYRCHSCMIGDSVPVRQNFEDMIRELQLKKPYFQDIVQARFYQLLALIGRLSAPDDSSEPGAHQFDRLILELNHSYRKAWDVPSMAEFCCLSPDYFAHAFKQTVGMSPAAYLARLRMEKAKELLVSDNLTIASIASLTGYRDPFYFSSAFKRAEGCSPIEYRKRLRS